MDEPSLADPLLESWEIHARINLYLLDAIAPEALGDRSASKGRTVAEQLAHVHNVRLMWLKEAAPELLEGLAKVEKEAAADHALLRSSLEGSGAAVSALLHRALAGGGKVRGFKPHAAAFLGYLVSHESHHRGQIALTLKQAGHPLDRGTAFGLWEWGVR
ncbi:MAG TPA: DinB family protein [Longimicrobiaceae bacterium]|nr:DinB family protein [Longimicrobiaceae bacterium]